MMDRRNFLQKTGMACMSMCALQLFVQSCSNVQYVSGTLSGKQIIVKKADFIIKQKDKLIDRSFVLVKHETLNFPICIYKVSENLYSALYLQCSHQGCEVNAYTTQLICPCHGSEFDTTGKVLQGPAETDLHQFAVTTNVENIIVQLT